ncbi:DcuS/MalK family sensor histidine kinase [Ammoniphilus sp. CFH 90114]|uniref:DcuS/MalK family sensor histidine kinase n=1 Tax=Ammoniphilus sp. CFH 90114 TaxID=2493665 RepID=UPI00100FE9C8|nr:DcuS/MalK family sensor histidine kinase [Ammoniphilus sp. CFH 90114]RXT02294.1 two-component system sensor histidine kinase DcuS [Ammoniphilus sp. CFH 90114]
MRKWSLQTTIVILVCFVVILALLVTNLLVSQKIAGYAEGIQAEKAKNIARVVSRSPHVVEALTGQRDPSTIQDFANHILSGTDVQFVVVMDMEGLRKSHPDPEKIGEPFVGGDENRVLQGEEYTSVAQGTLGLSLRSFSPIFDPNGQQVGAVAVGITLAEVESAIAEGRMTVFLGIGLGGVVGLVGAWVLARRIRRILYGLEPTEIAKLLEERNVMLQSVREGVMAVNTDGVVTLVNEEAIRLFRQAGVEESVLGKHIQDLVPHSELLKVLVTGKARYDQEQHLRGVSVLVNSVPWLVNGVNVGAVATFRDMTEMKLMAEQLSGVKLYAEALRAQSHEFMNKMHVVLGMIHIGFYDKLKQYIQDITNNQQSEMGHVMSKIKDPVIAGFLLGKLAHARERGIDLTLMSDSFLPELNRSELTHEMITIAGNLLTNAFEAVEEQKERRVEILCLVEDGLLHIDVWDSGSGIPEEMKEQILEKGFSTKGEEDRGIGLFLVSRSVEQLGGRIKLESNRESGTRFTVEIPLVGDEVKE